MASIKKWAPIVLAAAGIGVILAILLALTALAWGYDDVYGVLVAAMFGMQAKVAFDIISEASHAKHAALLVGGA